MADGDGDIVCTTRLVSASHFQEPIGASLHNLKLQIHRRRTKKSRGSGDRGLEEIAIEVIEDHAFFPPSIYRNYVMLACELWDVLEKRLGLSVEEETVEVVAQAVYSGFEDEVCGVGNQIVVEVEMEVDEVEEEVFDCFSDDDYDSGEGTGDDEIVEFDDDLGAEIYDDLGAEIGDDLGAEIGDDFSEEFGGDVGDDICDDFGTEFDDGFNEGFGDDLVAELDDDIGTEFGEEDFGDDLGADEEFGDDLGAEHSDDLGAEPGYDFDEEFGDDFDEEFGDDFDEEFRDDFYEEFRDDLVAEPGDDLGAEFSYGNGNADEVRLSEVDDAEEGGVEGRMESLVVEAGSDNCAICWDEFSAGIEAVKLVPCGHIFHESCMRPWLKMKRNCPMCRKRIKGE